MVPLPTLPDEEGYGAYDDEDDEFEVSLLETIKDEEAEVSSNSAFALGQVCVAAGECVSMLRVLCCRCC